MPLGAGTAEAVGAVRAGGHLGGLQGQHPVEAEGADALP
jgi:hypothetical protein